MKPKRPPHPFKFFEQLIWLDGTPLWKTIEPYRRRIFDQALHSFDPSGRPKFNFVLCGRAKKNWKTSDLILAGLYRFLAWPSPQGNDAFILANDEGQAGDDLSLAKKLIAVNPVLEAEVDVKAKEIVRRDGRGSFRILPARDVVGAHGKTALFVGYDEIHAYRDHGLFEALAPDPTRLDTLTWVTSYAGIRHAPGIPLYDFTEAAKRGDDPRMFFSWYSGDYCNDPRAADLPPEQRANPSAASWGNDDYLQQQRRRLPTHKFRRLHLNLPGAPDGAAFNGDAVLACIVSGRTRLPRQKDTTYYGFVDMSGGSGDDAALGIAHRVNGRVVLDMVAKQDQAVPFNPRLAVRKFGGILREYGLREVTGDRYAGETFRADFATHGITYLPCSLSKSELYEELEPLINAGEVELLDVATLQEQLLTLVCRGGKIDHQPGDHDDWANAAAGAIWRAAGRSYETVIPPAGVFGGMQRINPWTDIGSTPNASYLYGSGGHDVIDAQALALKLAGVPERT